jgi:formamidopyrimidine-DNA glycosylase
VPELPEVETVRRALDARLKGLAIESFHLPKRAFNRPPVKGALDGLIGSRVESVGRRGKYLIMRLDTGKHLILHLGMSGRIVFGTAGPHTRFQMTLEGAVVMSFHDARRFGTVGCDLPELGPEPLEDAFNGEALFQALRGRKAPVKALLLDQAVVAGVGNIYATEALFESGIRPARRADSLSRQDCDRLAAAIKRILAQAVELGGSTLEDTAYLDPNGDAGYFQLHVKVYGRKTGACGHALKATKKPLAGRTSLYCPICQK